MTICKRIKTPSIYTKRKWKLFFHGRKLGRHLLCVTIGLFNIPQVTVSEEKFLVTYYDDNNIITCCVCLGGILEESKKKRKKKKSFLIYWLKKLIPFVLKSLVLQTKKTGRCNMPPSRRIMFGCNCCYDIVDKLLIVGLRYITFC